MSLLTILASEEPNKALLPGDINEFIWGTVAFAIILGVFLWKGVPPLRRVMAARTERIRTELADAAAQRAEAEAELSTLEEQLGDADADAARIVADAREQATKLEADLVARAEAEIAEARDRARLEIQIQRDQALADLRAAVAAQARTAAEAVVRANLDDTATQSALIDDYISQLAG